MKEEWQKGLQEQLKAHHIDSADMLILKRIAVHTCGCLEQHREELKDSSKVEDILGDCVGTAPKADLQKALNMDGGNLSAMEFGEIISFQLLNDGCTIYLDAVLHMLQHIQKGNEAPTVMPTDEELILSLKSLNIDARGVPYIKSIEKSVCACIGTNKAKFDAIKDYQDFAEKLGVCMENESTMKDFKKLAELAKVKFDQSFSEQIGRICGERMTKGTCPAFLDIITKNIDKLQ